MSSLAECGRGAHPRAACERARRRRGIRAANRRRARAGSPRLADRRKPRGGGSEWASRRPTSAAARPPSPRGFSLAAQDGEDGGAVDKVAVNWPFLGFMRPVALPGRYAVRTHVLVAALLV